MTNMNDVAQEIGRLIRLRRQSTPPPKTRRKNQGDPGWRPHMTIEELAKVTGLTVTTVNKLELGYKAPRIESLLLLAEAFNCDPNDLLPSPSPKSRRTAKSELLEESQALASQMSTKQLREFVRLARGMILSS